MKEVWVSELSPGHVLARPVTGRNGMVMLEAGTALTERYIWKLKQLGVRSVYIRSQEPTHGPVSRITVHAADLPDAGPLPDIEKLKENAKARETACAKVVGLPESERLLERVTIPSWKGQFRRVFRDVLTEITANREIADELGVLLQTDRYLFEHSLHVALYAGVIGMARNYDTNRLYDLTVGALLFDIGMTRLPQRLIKMNRSLTETERRVVRQHTIEGYRILSRIRGVSDASAKCALFHHERYRGEGYPFGVRWNDIPEYARIVAIADVYDALVSPRHHRQAYTPGEAVEYLFASGNYEFGLELVQHFIRHLTVYPVSSVIRLSSGQVGVVTQLDASLRHRPVVRIIREADGSEVPHPYEIDLARNKNVVILSTYPEIQERDEPLPERVATECREPVG